jgi:hypothetical protein
LTSSNENDIYVVGRYLNATDFSTSLGISSATSDEGKTMYLLKFDEGGNLAWYDLVGNNCTICYSLYSGGDDGVYLAGAIGGRTGTGFNSRLNGEEIVSYGEDDGFVARFDGDGSYEWDLHIGGPGVDKCLGVVENNGRVFVTGSFEGDVKIEPETCGLILQKVGGLDGFLLCLAEGKPGD